MSLHSECERQIMQAGQSEMITALNVYDKWDKMSHKKKVSCHSQLGDICKKRPATFKALLP